MMSKIKARKTVIIHDFRFPDQLTNVCGRVPSDLFCRSCRVRSIFVDPIMGIVTDVLQTSPRLDLIFY